MKLDFPIKRRARRKPHELLDFTLPPEREAAEPPEARGLARDAVRLMVTYADGAAAEHTVFNNLPAYLEAGDVLVINTSGTLMAALQATRADGTPFVLHLSTQVSAGLWIAELRLPDGPATRPFFEARPGEHLALPGDAAATLLTPYLPNQHATTPNRTRLWIASLALPLPLHLYLDLHGSPIRYGYVRRAWPKAYYQTVYATEPGSAEMPSAGRAFTPELITRLVARGIQVAPLLLHTGVASPEEDEPPYEEYYRVPPVTARAVNLAHRDGRRVVAVGTTVIRALETATDEAGTTHPGEGLTGLVIRSGRRLRAVDALLTGFHEPRSTHLAMLEALAGAGHLHDAYTEALAEDYLWHEFGDLHLILPRRRPRLPNS